ncbi:unnamed protein product, partial [Brassica rapa subsp. narinosa]
IVVQLFKVYDAFGDYLTTTHPYKIGFFPTTLLENLMNVIGQIVNFGSLENKMIKGKDNIKFLIELRDQSNVKMMCTLWGRYAKQVYDYSMSNMSTMIICVIRLCSVKEWKGI